MHLAMLDMGQRKYGDATVCQIGGKVILVDGAHRGDDRSFGDPAGGWKPVPSQLEDILGHAGPYEIDLLIVTHCHCDHIGCLPELVTSNLVKAKWALLADPRIGFGIPLDQPFPNEPVGANDRVAAALIEEPLPDGAPSEEIEALIDAAATLQTRYAAMIDHLRANGCRVVLYGREPHDVLERTFLDIGLKVLGPSVDQLLICAHRIERDRQRTIMKTTTAVLTDGADEVALYRNLISQPLRDDEPLEDGGTGAAVNNQSIVVRIGAAPNTVLLTGDMQLANFGVGHLQSSMAQLRQAIRNAGPYAFVRLSHHGAANGTDAPFLDAIPETALFGISTGAGDANHPSRSVLDLLADRSPKVAWARTDRNGLVTLRLANGAGEWNLARGELSDCVTSPAKMKSVRRPAVPPRTETARSIEGGDMGLLSTIPRLTFVTDLAKLRSRIGEQADQAVEQIRNAGHSVVDLIADLSPMEIAQCARGSAGLVVLGGYNVLPAVTVDAVPPGIRAQLPRVQKDPDNYVVWSDDLYGDPEGSGFPTIPVSRIPDSPQNGLPLAAFDSSARGTGSFGLRNCNRPFADAVFARLSADTPILQTEPLASHEITGDLLNVENVYLMLHGERSDLSLFYGEARCPDGSGVNNWLNAFAVGNIPESCRATVFAGCCWGALIVREIAAEWDENAPLTDLTVDESVALTFLHAGARAFVGSTGLHYSPPIAPFTTASGPLHHSFWKHTAMGKAPAQALLEAKYEYMLGPLNDDMTNATRAVAYKTLRQFTCLGLGW